MAKLFGNMFTGELETRRGLTKKGLKKENLESAGWLDLTKESNHYNTKALEVWVQKYEEGKYNFETLSPKNNKFKKLLLELGYKQIKKAGINYIGG